MPISLTILPLKPGMTEEYKTFANTLLTSKKKEYQARLKYYDLGKTTIWIETILDRDYSIVAHEAGINSKKLLANWEQSTHPFDLWFREQVSNCFDIDAVKNSKAIQPTIFGEIAP